MKRNGTITAAVVGAGYFGARHCEKLSRLPGVKLEAVVDIDAGRAQTVAGLFHAQAITTHRQLDGIQAAVVAVPTSQHYQVARDLLEQGVDLLVEKPLAATPEQAEDLCRLAAANGRVLQVGHLERFDPRWLQLRQRAGQLRLVEVERCGPYTGRGGDVDVVREIMVHDLDMLRQFTKADLCEIHASGRSLCTPHIDKADVRLGFADGLKAHLVVARGNGCLRRRVRVSHEGGELELDLLSGDLTENGPAGRVQHEVLPASDSLWRQDRVFFEVLGNGRIPPVGGGDGLAAVRLAADILARLVPEEAV